MKIKLLFFYLTASIVLFSVGCSSSESNTGEQSESQETTQEPNQETSTNSESAWEKVQVVDEFGDVIEGKGAILGIFKGKMSNSATSNSDVTVKIQLGKETDSYITFYEYDNVPGNLPEKKMFSIKIKKENGETEFIEQFSMNNMMTDTKGVLIQKAMEQNEPLKVNVDLSRASQYENTVYNFEIDTKGLAELLQN